MKDYQWFVLAVFLAAQIFFQAEIVEKLSEICSTLDDMNTRVYDINESIQYIKLTRTR
jgi:hypothetical protein